MPVFLKLDPNGGTQLIGAIVPNATRFNDGVITKEMFAQLQALIDNGGAATWNVVATQVGGDTYNAAANDYVPCDATLGNVGVVLPDATTCKGKRVAVKDAAGGNTSPAIKVTTTGGQTIDGQSSLTLTVVSNGNNFAEVQFTSDGANWLVGAAYAGHV